MINQVAVGAGEVDFVPPEVEIAGDYHSAPHLELVPPLIEGSIEQPSVLASLTPKQRAAVELRYSEEGLLSFNDVAATLGTTRRAAERLVDRASEELGDVDIASALAAERLQSQEPQAPAERPEPMPEGPFGEYLTFAQESVRKINYLGKADRDDVVQIVMARLLLQGGVPHPKDPAIPFNPAGYIGLAIENEAINRNKNIGLTKPSVLDENQTANTGPIDESQIYTLNPEEVVIRTERDQFVLEAISQLHPRHKEILSLIAEGCDYQQAADELKVSVGTVMSGLSRARAKIRKILEESMHHPSFNPVIHQRLMNAGQQG